MAGYIGSKSSVTQVDGYSEAEADAEFVNDPNGAITVSGSNVGIGTSSPLSLLDVTLEATGQRRFLVNYDDSAITIKGSNGSSNPESLRAVASTFKVNTGTSGSGTERMRIDSSGNVLVGKTTDAFGTAGTVMRQQGIINITRANGSVLNLNRTGSNGALAEFHKDSTTVGSIGVVTNNITIGSGDTGFAFLAANEAIVPWNMSSAGYRDNVIDLGVSSVRFDDIYATNGTIQTSDFNEKQDIASLTATEMLVGARISTLFKTFRWKDSVAEKGDNARTHTGVIAQDVQAAFTAEGLDAGDYALFISSTWWETQTEVPAVEAVEAVEAVTETTTDEEGNEVVTVITEAVEAVEAKDAYTRTDNYDTEAEAPEGATSKTRMGIRYPELLSFVAAYNEQRFASIEARLTALEA